MLFNMPSTADNMEPGLTHERRALNGWVKICNGFVQHVLHFRLAEIKEAFRVFCSDIHYHLEHLLEQEELLPWLERLDEQAGMCFGLMLCWCWRW